MHACLRALGQHPTDRLTVVCLDLTLSLLLARNLKKKKKKKKKGREGNGSKLGLPCKVILPEIES